VVVRRRACWSGCRGVGHHREPSRRDRRQDGVARTNPSAATRLLAEAANAPAVPVDPSKLQQAIEAATPLVKARLAAVQDARWRASDRDRFARRLIPWVLSAARRAARRGDGHQLHALDTLVSRLALGMTAGEELLLDDVLSRREPLSVRDLLAWHMRFATGRNRGDDQPCRASRGIGNRVNLTVGSHDVPLLDLDGTIIDSIELILQLLSAHHGAASRQRADAAG
jgi:hypothetical protein